MQTFLQKAVDEILSKHPVIDDTIWIVIPNRRGSVFIKKFLSEKIEKPCFSPTILSIEDFIKKISPKNIAENDILIFELYEIFKKNELPFSQTFDEFLTIANSILHDFNEIDLHLANPKTIYLELNRLKAIELWTPNGEELTELQKRFLQFYNILFDVYIKFKESLESKNLSYQGMMYRHTAENIETNESAVNTKHIYFCGFNALSKSEEKIIRHFIKNKQATLLWQGDQYYIENENHEAGKFLRTQTIENLKNAKWIENDYQDIPKNIHITGVSKNIGQVKAAGNILLNNLTATQIEKTAIVLADETLLPALLNSLPSSIDKVNITMGLPIKATPTYGFFESIFKLHYNAYKLTRKTNSKVFYHKDVINIISHPIFTEILSENKLPLTQKLIKSNKIFISPQDIISNLQNSSNIPIVQLIFNPWDNQPTTAIHKIQEIIAFYRKHLLENIKTVKVNNFLLKIQLEYLFEFHKLFNRLEMLIFKYEAVKEIKTLHKLFQQVISNQTISFYGEPLKGLQIMGILETRTLDFENIIMLSVNEDILPSGKSFNSIIPFQIKFINNIPTHLDKDSIFAYHFYRLLQKAKNIHLLYDCDPGSERNEKSRFIKQLEVELPAFNPKTNIQTSFFSFPPDIQNKKTISIPNEPNIINKIEQIAKKGFSPSAINQYVNCTLKFYFIYIARIDEKEEISEDVDAQIMGTIIHQILHDIYKPLLGKILTTNDLNLDNIQITDLLTSAFNQHFNNGNYTQGKNLLTYKIIENLIKLFLQKEIDQIQEGRKIRILFLEKEFKRSLKIPKHETEILIKGFIDRIDEIDNHIRIIDYKTGFVDDNKLTIKQIDTLFTSEDMDKAIQLLTYQYLYNGNDSDKLNISSGLISFRKINKYYMPLKIEGENNTSTIADFSLQLSMLFKELFSPNNQFVQTDNIKKCSYCQFKNICNR